jgi:DGQHR domain-containing protein
MSEKKFLRIPAIEVQQSPGRVLYSFAIDGKQIPTFATISRVRRNGAVLEGYQRPEVLAHIGEIRDYLESPSPMIPNAIVVAFDSRVRFEPGTLVPTETTYTRSGTLNIPIDDSLTDDEKPGFVVDGQQRLAAIREAAIPSFPICITAFIAKDIREQTEQFILVNSTKPLPKGLIYELLPSTEAKLTSLLQRRRFPALLLDRLNRDKGSPLEGKIQTPTTPTGTIKDNSILRMLENSLSDGVLYRFREDDTEDRVEDMLAILRAFWSATSKVFKHAWQLPPRRSRLTHGAGIVSLGFVMDAIAERHRADGLPSEADFEADLKPLEDTCRWTDGIWDFGPGCQRKWSEIQNTSKDIQLLSNYLLVQYKARVWNLKAPDKSKAKSQGDSKRARSDARKTRAHTASKGQHLTRQP